MSHQVALLAGGHSVIFLVPSVVVIQAFVPEIQDFTNKHVDFFEKP
jgi:hypothetical protein